MSEQEFRTPVQNAAPFESAERADRVARATLSRLGKNLSEDIAAADFGRRRSSTA